jgi:hypothetical protein
MDWKQLLASLRFINGFSASFIDFADLFVQIFFLSWENSTESNTSTFFGHEVNPFSASL